MRLGFLGIDVDIGGSSAKAQTIDEGARMLEFVFQNANSKKSIAISVLEETSLNLSY
jgi:hypothetical protein